MSTWPRAVYSTNLYACTFLKELIEEQRSSEESSDWPLGCLEFVSGQNVLGISHFLNGLCTTVKLMTFEK